MASDTGLLGGSGGVRSHHRSANGLRLFLMRMRHRCVGGGTASDRWKFGILGIVAFLQLILLYQWVWVGTANVVSQSEPIHVVETIPEHSNNDAKTRQPNQQADDDIPEAVIAPVGSWKIHEQLKSEHVLDKISYWNHNVPIPKPHGDLFARSEKKQYLTFEIDKGGFNNIRMQLETMVHIALATRRTFVLTIPHYWYLFDGIENQIGDYFDIESLRSVIDVIDASEYLALHGVSAGDDRYTNIDKLNDFYRNHENAFSPRWETGSKALVLPSAVEARKRVFPPLDKFLKGRSIIEYDEDLSKYETLHFRSDYEQHYRVLVMPCTFLYFADIEWQRYHHGVIRDHFHYHPRIFELAAPLITALLKDVGRYNAIHIRRGDFQFKEVWIPYSQVAANVKALLDPSMTLFVATDVKNVSELDGLRDVYKNIRFLSDYSSLLPSDMNRNYYGMIDQLICSVAERFVGTDLSTFSANIVRLRAFMGSDVAPDKLMYVNTDMASGEALADGWRTFATWMDLPHLPKWEGAYTWAREFFMAWHLQ